MLVAGMMERIHHRGPADQAPESERDHRVDVDQVEIAPVDHFAHGPGDVVQIGQIIRRPLAFRVAPAQLGARRGISRCEQGDVVTTVDQAFDQLVYHQFRSAIVPGRDPKERSRNHCDFHMPSAGDGTGSRRE